MDIAWTLQPGSVVSPPRRILNTTPLDILREMFIWLKVRYDSLLMQRTRGLAKESFLSCGAEQHVKMNYDFSVSQARTN